MMSCRPDEHRLLVLDDYARLSDRYKDDLDALGLQYDVLHEPVPSGQLVETLLPYTILFIMRERTKIPREVLEKLPNLRMITSTGQRNRGLDIAYAFDRGVTVCGTLAADGSNSAAGTVEQTWALTLALSRRLVVEHNAMAEGLWQTGIASGLYGRTIGLVGLGRIGQQVAVVAKAFGMHVKAWSPNLTQERATKAGVEMCETLELLLRAADVVSLHIVLSESTRSIIGTEQLSQMKRTAFLVNTSRGPLVDEGALLSAIETGSIAGAGLDVFDVEPLPSDHRLRRHPNIILSPHMGYVDEASLTQMWSQSIDNIAAFLAGSPKRVLARDINEK